MKKFLIITVLLLFSIPLYSKNFTRAEVLKICETNNLSALKKSIAAGYDIDSKIYSGEATYGYLLTYSLQYSLLFSGKFDIPKWLIENGADVNKRGNLETYPLTMASRMKETWLTKLLLRHGVQVNAREKDGTFPIHVAVENKNIKMIKLLLKNGAHIDVKNNMGRTPLHLSIRYNYESMIKFLIKNYAVINIRDKKGDTPLHLATLYNKPYHARILLNKGADINIRNNNLDTPLHSAVRSKNFAMISFLLRYRANTEIENKSGKKPFDYCKLDEYLWVKGIRSNSYLHRYFSRHPEYSYPYTKYASRLKRYGVIKTEFDIEKEEKKRKSRKRNLAIKLTIPPLYLGTSIFLREYTFRGNPQNNHFATFNGMLGMSIVGGLVVGGIGLLIGTSSKSKKFSTVLGPMVFGAVVGIVAGGYLGYRYRSYFKNNRGLYYGATAVFCIPILVIRF